MENQTSDEIVLGGIHLDGYKRRLLFFRVRVGVNIQIVYHPSSRQVVYTETSTQGTNIEERLDVPPAFSSIEDVRNYVRRKRRDWERYMR